MGQHPSASAAAESPAGSLSMQPCTMVSRLPAAPSLPASRHSHGHRLLQMIHRVNGEQDPSKRGDHLVTGSVF